MIAMLQQQEHNEGIPALLPLGVNVAHKTGWIDRLYHDVAIVYPPHHVPFILVIMTSGFADASEAHALVAGLSRSIYYQLVPQ
jgi:beta-lactamase class A